MSKFLILSIVTLMIGCASKQNVPSQCSNVASCIQLVKKTLESNFVADEKVNGYSVKIEFWLNDDAEVVNYQVITESDIPELKIAGINAIKNSSPFSALKSLRSEEFNEFKHIVLTIIPPVE
jgi:hypothetical protein